MPGAEVRCTQVHLMLVPDLHMLHGWAKVARCCRLRLGLQSKHAADSISVKPWGSARNASHLLQHSAHNAQLLTHLIQRVATL